MNVAAGVYQRYLLPLYEIFNGLTIGMRFMLFLEYYSSYYDVLDLVVSLIPSNPAIEFTTRCSLLRLYSNQSSHERICSATFDSQPNKCDDMIRCRRLPSHARVLQIEPTLTFWLYPIYHKLYVSRFDKNIVHSIYPYHLDQYFHNYYPS